MSADELLNVLHSSKRVSSVPMRLVRVVCQFITATDYVKAVVYYFEELRRKPRRYFVNNSIKLDLK